MDARLSAWVFLSGGVGWCGFFPVPAGAQSEGEFQVEKRIPCREFELKGRYEENALLWRMLKVVGHEHTELMELEGYGHGMTEPGFPLLLEFVWQVTGAGNGRDRE